MNRSNKLPGTLLAILGAVSVACTAGCDPRAFSDLADSTKAKTTDKPAGLKSDVYVAQLTFAATDETDGTRVAIGGDFPAGLGTVRFEATGSSSADGQRLFEVLSGIDADSLGDIDGSRTLIGVDPGSSAVAGQGSVAVGMPDEENGGLIVIVEGKDEFRAQATFNQNGNLNDPDPVALGDSVAFVTSNFNDNANNLDTPDLAASASNRIYLFPDVVAISPKPNPRTCAIDRERIHQIVAGDFDAASDGEEIVIMSGDLNLASGSGAGQVKIFSGQLVADADADPSVECFDLVALPPRVPFVIDAPNGEFDFGTVMAVGNFNGSGGPDLAVAAPAFNTVYVYLDLDATPGAASPTPDAQINGPSGSARFGNDMSAGNLNGGGDELIVGDPFVDVDGVANAGSAYIYEQSGGAFSLAQTLHDADPEENQEFGRAVLISPFGVAGDAIVSVGAKDELFTYFQTLLAGDEDVRQ